MQTASQKETTVAAFAVRQLLLLIVGGAALWWGWSLDRCAADPPILWPLALVVWVTQSMFWLGWRHHDLKLLFLLSGCLLYTSPSPRDKRQSRMPSSA